MNDCAGNGPQRKLRPYGWGGLSAVSEATGLSRNTIRRGAQELEVRKKKPKAVVEVRLRWSAAATQFAVQATLRTSTA